MRRLGLMFVAGVLLLQQMSALPSLNWLLLLPLLAVAVFALPRSGSMPRSSFLLLFRQLLLLATAFAFGLLWAALCAHSRLGDALPPEWEGRDIKLVGVIASLPQAHERGERLEFDVERILTAGAQVPGHISISDYSAGFAARAAAESLPKTRFHAGERWQLTVRLKRPHGTLNPHGFDYEAWALEQNIRASGYIRQAPDNRLLDSFVWRPAYMVEAVREHIRSRMQRELQGKAFAGVLQALAIGDDAAISQHDWQVFLKTGTNHLMSISGLHITMLAGLLFAVVYQLWRRQEKLVLRLPARKAATVAGAVAALLYALIAGFSIPTQRTLYMLSVFAWALWQGRNAAISHVLVLALLLVVVLDPWAVLAAGFWLSFGAVAVIAYAAAGRLRPPGWLGQAINTQWAVSLGLVPLLLLMFQQVSLVSPLANAVAIPLISLLVVPLTLLGAMLPMDWALLLAHWVMHGCMQLLYWLASSPVSTWQQHAPPLWTLPFALLGMLWLLLPRGFPMRWLGVIGFLPMLLLKPETPHPGAMQVTVLDVGQGLAVVVRTANHALLYDAGLRYSAQNDSGSRIVTPYLRGEGIHRLDGFVVSHDDNDHSGGMHSVLQQQPVGWLLSSLPASPEGYEGMPQAQCHAGQAWQWDGVQFRMLGPARESYQQRHVSKNNRSCVLRVDSRFGSLLLPGDIERAAEKTLVGDFSHVLPADVLVAPHHGSKTSSTPAFVEKVEPRAVVFTVGYRNRFGHPKDTVVRRYAALGSRLYRSDHDGAILLDFSRSQGIAITRWRAQARRYWHQPPPAALAEKLATR